MAVQSEPFLVSRADVIRGLARLGHSVKQKKQKKHELGGGCIQTWHHVTETRNSGYCSFLSSILSLVGVASLVCVAPLAEDGLAIPLLVTGDSP